MIDVLAALALALAPVSAAPQAPGKGEENDEIIDMRADDPEMNAAIARGRASLSDFLRRFASPRQGDSEFMVRFDIDPTEGAEYVWAEELDRSGRVMTGILVNQPVQTGDRRGDRVSIPKPGSSTGAIASAGSPRGASPIASSSPASPPRRPNPFANISAGSPRRGPRLKRPA